MIAAILIARWRRYWHTLRGMFQGHMGITTWVRGDVTLIGCTCGRIFWKRP